ncbi:hypothetical protein HAX54_012262, partial [Datura stramonium]|nr:hypothetical protein [Datura stramonium]
MPLKMEEAFNIVMGAMDMFITYMANGGQWGDQPPSHTGRRDGSMSSKVKEFINLDPLEFCGPKPEQDPVLWSKEVDPKTWNEFTIANFTPEEDREFNANKFELLRQGSMSDTTATTTVSMEAFASV